MGKLLIGLILIVLGILTIVAPKGGKKGARDRASRRTGEHTEPDLYLIVYRMGGGVLVLVGIIYLLAMLA